MNIEIIRNTLYKVGPWPVADWPLGGAPAVVGWWFGGLLGQDAAVPGSYPGGLSASLLAPTMGAGCMEQVLRLSACSGP